MAVSGVRRSWEMLVMAACSWVFPCLKQCCMARSCSRDWLSVSARRHKSLSRQESVIGLSNMEFFWFSIANAGIRAALGKLFTWKAGILVAVVLLSLMFYRPFCKWICPLGAVYALFNKVSLLQMHIDTGKCVSCGKCTGVCKMDVDVVRHPNHTECIRCGACVKECPVEAISYKYGFAEKSKKKKENN